MVKEKECRVRESMKMMGLTDTAYWFSWFFHYTVINLAMCFLAWLLLCVNVIEYSAKFEIWVMLFMYGEAVFGQIIVVSALFSKAKFSGLVGTVLYYIFFFFNFFLTSASTTYSEKIWWSIFPQVAVNNMAQVYAGLESAQIGVHFDTAGDNITNFTWKAGIWMLFFDFFIWVAFGLWIDQVWVREYGERKPFYFCCTPRWWGCG
jgi:hypothetical protein